VTVFRTHRTPLAVIAGVSALAALTACGNKVDTAGAAAGPIKVDATDTACTVSASTTTGQVTFEITNKGTNVTEFYLYAEGDRIMGELENIAPGLSLDPPRKFE
jgi:iron uptake system component EfeO